MMKNVSKITPFVTLFVLRSIELRIKISIIEDVECGAELSFSGASSASSSNFVFKRPNFGFTQTDGRTDAINKFWAFLVKN